MWEVTVEGGRAVRLAGSTHHGLTAGQLCPKVNRFLRRVYHPDRLTRPLRRTGAKGAGTWEEIDWEEAIETIAQQLSACRDLDGPESILQFSFDGTQGVIQKGVIADRFFDRLGASDIRRDLCGVTSWLGASDVSGLPLGLDPEELESASTIVCWGTNTVLTNRHLWPVIERARSAGAVVITVDPVRTVTASRSDVHLQLRPGTDVALVLAVIHVLDRDDLIDRDWLAAATSGWAELAASALAMPPAAAAPITGIDVDRIEWFARVCALDQPVAIRTLVGPEHREHGRDLMRAIALLPAVTGSWRHRGGGLARSTQVYFEEALAYPERLGDRRRFNMADLGRVLNDADLDPPIAALVVHNTNPAVICPDQNRVLEGLARPDLFTVVIEQFETDTARYADVVLPATTQIEHLDLGIAWGHLHLSLNQPAIPPVGEALPNSEVFRRLASALGIEDPLLAMTDAEVIRSLLDSGHPWLTGIDYDRLAAQGWARLAVPAGYRPNVDEPPATPDGRLRLGPLAFRPGSETVEGDQDLARRYPLTLLSPKQHTGFLNANYGPFPEHQPIEGEPRLRLHPIDADARSIVAGDTVQVVNERGCLTVTASVSDDVLPGVVSLPFGWWHGAVPEGRSVNALTNPAVGADGVGSAFFNETLVEVRLVGR